MTSQTFSMALHDLLFYMNVQAWKVVFLNFMTFHDWGTHPDYKNFSRILVECRK